jgi:hypothetical protein
MGFGINRYVGDGLARMNDNFEIKGQVEKWDTTGAFQWRVPRNRNSLGEYFREKGPRAH